MKKPPALLDLNVLVALFDPDHLHHEAAHKWFGANRARGWATCPATETGLVRMLSNPAYAPEPETPAEILKRLAKFCGSGHHVFWPAEVSLRDARVFAARLPASSRSLADVYLLGLAVHRQGRLASFDRQIPVAAVKGGATALEIIAA